MAPAVSGQRRSGGLKVPYDRIQHFLREKMLSENGAPFIIHPYSSTKRSSLVRYSVAALSAGIRQAPVAVDCDTTCLGRLHGMTRLTLLTSVPRQRRDE